MCGHEETDLKNNKNNITLQVQQTTEIRCMARYDSRWSPDQDSVRISYVLSFTISISIFSYRNIYTSISHIENRDRQPPRAANSTMQWSHEASPVWFSLTVIRCYILHYSLCRQYQSLGNPLLRDESRWTGLIMKCHHSNLSTSFNDKWKKTRFSCPAGLTSGGDRDAGVQGVWPGSVYCFVIVYKFVGQIPKS